MTQVSVVIPYFQRERGILKRALQSIIEQDLPADVLIKVVVVDDESPSPIEPETEGLTFPPSISLITVKQKNGGVGAARDTGLKNIGDETDYVAFLDSDDYWKKLHIATALQVLEQGYDFYFTDHSRDEHHASHFDYIGFPPPTAKSHLQEIGRHLFEVDKDYLFSYFLRKFTAQISTVIYRRLINPDAKFESALKSSGEDFLFLLQLILCSKKLCFSTKPWATCGKGINIYYSTFGWNDEGHLRRHMADILAAYYLISALQLAGSNKQHIQSVIKNARQRFAFFSIRWFIKGTRPWSQELKGLTRRDPGFWLWYPLTSISVTVLYLLKLYKPT
ncbi:MAG: glycosyltransferase family 2 protein [Alphaproteobacteria bacterium]